MTLRIPLLLTSAGITNPSLKAALIELLGKPIEESTALAIPTASYGHPHVSPHQAWKFIAGVEYRTPMVELGWKSVGILELAALPSIGDDRWKDWVREADVLLVNGGEPAYLAYWMRQSGFADLLPTLEHTVYVGLSAGSVVMSPQFGDDFVSWHSPLGAGDTGLGVIDFAMFPHLDHPELPENTMAHAEQWAAGMSIPSYAIDDATGIRVVDGALDVISEGHWKRLDPGS
jgi:dipeptidase E